MKLIIQAETAEEMKLKVLQFAGLFGLTLQGNSPDVCDNNITYQRNDAEGSVTEDQPSIEVPAASETPKTAPKETIKPAKKRGPKPRAGLENPVKNSEESAGISEGGQPTGIAPQEPGPEGLELTKTDEPTTGPATRADALKALEELNVQKGIAVARQVLNDNGWSKFSSVPESDYQKLINLCRKALA